MGRALMALAAALSVSAAAPAAAEAWSRVTTSTVATREWSHAASTPDWTRSTAGRWTATATGGDSPRSTGQVSVTLAARSEAATRALGAAIRSRTGGADARSNAVLLDQRGGGHAATVTQSGTGNALALIQRGRGAAATVGQTGGQASVTLQVAW